MNERVVQFGERDGLLGIVTEPAPSVRRADAPAVLLVTAGVLHRVGPFRVYVDLARRLADLGFVCLRFDISGVGDSELRTGAPGDEPRALADIRDAMAMVRQRYGIDRFVALGLCTGAYYSQQIALAEPSVCGAVLLDGYTYRTWGYYRRQWLTRLRETRRWPAMLRRRLLKLTRQGDSIYEPGALEEAEFFESLPPRAQAARELCMLAERGTKLLLIYSGGTGQFNHARQFEEMYGALPHGGDVVVEYHERADHTFSRLADRLRLVDVVADWMDERFAPVEMLV